MELPCKITHACGICFEHSDIEFVGTTGSPANTAIACEAMINIVKVIIFFIFILVSRQTDVMHHFDVKGRLCKGVSPSSFERQGKFVVRALLR
jgi:hypothetical protein